MTILGYLNEYNIVTALLAPWVAGDVVGVHMLGVLAGNNQFPFLVALIVPIFSEIIVEFLAGIFLYRYRYINWIQTARGWVNRIGNYRILEKFDSLSFLKKFLVILGSRFLPGTRPFLVALITTTNTPLKQFIPLLFFSTVIWYSFLVCTGFFIGKQLIAPIVGQENIIPFIIGYAVILFSLLGGIYIVKKKFWDKKRSETPSDTVVK